MTQQEIRERITRQIVEALKNGTAPWRQPWTGQRLPTNVVSKKRYSGANNLLLAIHQMRHDLRSNVYGTFNQWRDLGCRVKARPADVPSGEWGCSIIFTKPITKTELDDDGEEVETEFRVLRQYSVFSACQVEGDAAERILAAGSRATSFVDFEPAEEAIANANADIRFGGDKAFYRRPTQNGDGDFICCPHKDRFPLGVDYYATLLHELVGHWTEHRLGWKGSYAEGELRAEIAGCFAMTELGVPQSDDLSNHNAYLATWLKSLQSDPRFIFRAAADASKAVDFFLSFSRQPVSESVLVA